MVQPRRGHTRVYNDDHCVITHSFSIYDYTISSRRIALFTSAPRRLLARLASIDTWLQNALQNVVTANFANIDFL